MNAPTLKSRRAHADVEPSIRSAASSGVTTVDIRSMPAWQAAPVPAEVSATRGDLIAAAAILLAMIAYGLIRQACNDIGWHLATARTALADGAWPTVNTFSYTFADYPLFQQYPVYQSLLYACHFIGGWAGLSLLNCVGWLVVFGLFVRWGGRWSTAVVLHLPWMLAGMALQRRMLLRPDVLSMIWLGVLLLLIDAYRRRSRWWIAAVPVVHLLWANSHQLFPLSLAIQGILIGHLLLSRTVRHERLDDSDRVVPIWPAVVALAASVAASFFTPLGTRIVEVCLHTTDSLSQHRDHVHEFARIWNRPVEFTIASFCAIPAIWAIFRSRRSLNCFDLGVWLLSLVLMLSAVRGIVFFGVISVGLFSRTIARTGWPNFYVRAPAVRRFGVALTLLLASNIVYHRWISPPMVLGGTQPGLGRSLGDWPNRAISFLRTSRPPGRMMNMPWSLASPIIWELPEIPVFVDPRFESYPRAFLLDCIASHVDQNKLDALIATHHPNWILADHRIRGIRQRLESLATSGGWTPVYADTQTMILVRQSPENAAYLAKFCDATDPFATDDLLARPGCLRARQLVYFGLLLEAFGRRQEATTRIEQAIDSCESDSGTMRWIVRELKDAGSAIRPPEFG